MKRGINIALLPLLAIIIVAAAALVSATGNAAPAAVPLADGWTQPITVSGSANYDNTSTIGASPLNGAVTIGWEQRNDPTSTKNYVKQGSNTSLGGPFGQQTLATSDYLENGNVKVRADSQGRRHMVWWQQTGTNVTNYYAQISTSGTYTILEAVPGTSNGFLKGTALAVGPDDTLHMLFGRDNQTVQYWQRSAAGSWTVQGETVPVPASATHLTLAVSSQGVVMAGMRGNSPGGNYDIYTARRNSPGSWSLENVSSTCCSGCVNNSKAYLPSLERDSAGGIRLSWADEKCDPREDPRTLDLYYREWVPGTGWNNKPLVRVSAAPGEAYFNAITVEPNGTAHILYSDDTGTGTHNYQMYYVYGSGTTFSAPLALFRTWADVSFQKEPSVDYSPGQLHLTFNSNRTDYQKDVFYSRKSVAPAATATPVPTNTPIPPRCPGEQFTDVCPGDFFYEATTNLVNDGVISGYNTVPPCDAQSHIPCFKPFNNVTRAQASKIIALAANLPQNTQGAPHFADVPSSNSFYQWIEWSYNYGVLSGYPCGGANEPCGAGNKPYFRPGNSITRGQLSKMTSIAFNFNEAVSGQTFQDVPASNAFYTFVERIASRGIIGGYPCGGANEPCGPGNRPYFRPNASVTRGQTVKIIDGARP
jgi:hypothetical protein